MNPNVTTIRIRREPVYYVVNDGSARSVYRALPFGEFGNDRTINGTRTKWVTSCASMLDALRVITQIHPDA